MTPETYLQHQANNQYKITTDPLADLLDNLNKNPASYTNKQTADSITKGEKCIGQIEDKSLQQEAKNIGQCTKKTGTSHKEGTDDSRENIPTIQGSEVTRTRLGCIIKKLGRLPYC